MPNWTIQVDEKTDQAVRTHLARSGGGDAELSKFVADAARRAALRETVADFRAAFADLSEDEVQQIVDEAIDHARANRP